MGDTHIHLYLYETRCTGLFRGNYFYMLSLKVFISSIFEDFKNILRYILLIKESRKAMEDLVSNKCPNYHINQIVQLLIVCMFIAMHRHSNISQYSYMPAMFNNQCHLYRVLIKKTRTSINQILVLVIIILIILFACLLGCFWLFLYHLFMCFKYLLVHNKLSLFFRSSCNNCRECKAFLQMHGVKFSLCFTTSLHYLRILKVGWPVAWCGMCW